MKRLLALFLAATLPAPSTTSGEDMVPAHDQPATLKVEVLHCHDGDTCRVKLEDSFWFNVRLSGIDTPEVKGRSAKQKGQPMGEEARDFLNELVAKKTVQLRQTDLDPYNRLVVEIFLGNQNVNLMMVEKGLAEVYRGKAKRLEREPYFQAEKVAKDKGLGIWSIKNYQSPAAYRSETKN